MDNRTSLELSKKLYDNGCRLESEMCYVDTRKSWKSYNCPPPSAFETHKFTAFWDLDENSSECEFVKNEKPFPSEGYNESAPLPSFDILNEICCKYKREFFGEDFQEHTEIILAMLQLNEKNTAEKYILENCLFNKQNKS